MMDTTIVILLSIIAVCSASLVVAFIRFSKTTQLMINTKLEELINSAKVSNAEMSENVATECKSILNELKESKKDIVKGLVDLKDENIEKIDDLSTAIKSAQAENKESLNEGIKKLENISKNLKISVESSMETLNTSSVNINKTLESGLKEIVDALKETITLE